MKKRFLRLLCVLAFALPFIAATPCFAVTGNTEINQITYQYDTETGEAVVTGADEGISGDVEIPGTITVKGEEYAVTSIGDSAFYWCTGLTNVTIPEGVTSIGDNAFVRCTRLTQITIPVGVTSFGNYAFYNCSSLEEITIPEGVTSIGDNAFKRCTSLTQITIPESVTSIGDSAFYWCIGLTNVTIPEGVTSIGDDTFAYCYSLKEITIPGSVTSIGDDTFAYCYSLKEVIIPESVASIGDNAFERCTSLTQITIPEGVTSIGNYAFYNCSSLEEITIPGSVTSIGDWAFSGCDKLTNVYVEEGLSLGANSFSYASQDVHVWRYEVLESAEASDDGKTHVAIVSVKGKDGTDITASLAISDGAMGDGYVIDDVKPSNLTLKHTLTKIEATPATCTEPGNVECWTCDTCGKHFKDENGATEIEESKWIIPATGHSYGDDGHCMACGAVDSDFAPAIIAGANATWHKGSEDGLSFTSNAAFADFLKVQVDGKDVDASNYTVKEGSTIVTLNASYLETLSAGKHTLAIVSDTGTAETEFTVLAAEEEVADSKTANDSDKDSLAKTSDGSMLPIAALSVLVIASIAAGAIALRKSRM